MKKVIYNGSVQKLDKPESTRPSERIEFENGSAIEGIGSGECIRGKGYSVRAVEIKVGLKIEVRDSKLEEIKNNPYIKSNFKLNIKRLNRWWYSVYFDEICNHDCEPLVINNDKFCSKCKIRL